MPPKPVRNIVEMVKQVSLRIITDKNYPFTEGSSIMKQVAVATAEAVGLDPSVVKVGKFEREFAGAWFEKDGKLFYFFQKSALCQLVFENIPVGTERVDQRTWLVPTDATTTWSQQVIHLRRRNHPNHEELYL